jgi:hypothetical protein
VLFARINRIQECEYENQHCWHPESCERILFSQEATDSKHTTTETGHEVKIAYRCPASTIPQRKSTQQANAKLGSLSISPKPTTEKENRCLNKLSPED